MSVNKKNGFKDIVSSLIIATGLLATSAPSYSESMAERSNKRQEARHTKQSGREQARDTKAACKEGDTSRSECRQEKRHIKQKSRETARDIKRNWRDAPFERIKMEPIQRIGHRLNYGAISQYEAVQGNGSIFW